MRSPTQYHVEWYGKKTAITKHNLFAKQDTCWKSKFYKFLKSNFFMSCITGTTTNTKISSNIARPGIAYFILFRKNSKGNETVLFSYLHDTGTDVSVTRISSNKISLDEECTVIQGLKQVVKVAKIIFSYFKRTQRQFRNPVRHTIWTYFVKKESIAITLLNIIART